MTKNKNKQISRRKFIEKTTIASVGLGATISGFPAVHASEPITLRLLGIGVNAFPQIAEKAKEDLGIEIEFVTKPSYSHVMSEIINAPQDYDLFDIGYGTIAKLVPLGRFQPFDPKRLTYFNDISPLLFNGTIAGKELPKQGAAPFKLSFATSAAADVATGEQTDWPIILPTVYNADTVGVRPDLIKREVSSWADLLHEDFHGKVGLLNEPIIGILDVALAVEAAGKRTYIDKGNMTREEIDFTLSLMKGMKDKGHFTGFWTTFGESIEFMESGRAHIQSMWSPAVTKVRQNGVPCTYQPLKEGYRGWCFGMSLPKISHGRRLDATYEFINWFQSGFAGALLMRQGYYPTVMKTTKAAMEAYEWDYWINGKAALKDIPGPDGRVVDKKGNHLDGGSYERRMSQIICWNSLMDESRYLSRKWRKMLRG